MRNISSRRDLPKQILAALFGGFTLYLGIVVFWTLGYQLAYAGRIFPGVSVAGVELSGLSPNEAALKLSQTLSYPINGKILFRSADKVWVASPAELGMVFDPPPARMPRINLGVREIPSTRCLRKPTPADLARTFLPSSSSTSAWRMAICKISPRKLTSRLWRRACIWKEQTSSRSPVKLDGC
ncbi:MAG: hypothetical protein PHQ36_07245 [Anaerolineales bacterium]|nr:hypothetical protein [Anaerolineales bacterium]